MKALMLIFLLWLGFALGCANSHQDNVNQEPDIKLSAQAKINGNILTITNRDKFTYSKPNAIIQQGWGGFMARLPDIAPGKSISVSLSSFTDTDNQRFNVFTAKVSMITMECSVDGKKAYAGWRF